MKNNSLQKISKDNQNYRWVILVVFASSQIVLSIGGYGWGPLAPSLKQVLSLSITQIGTISSVFYFTSALTSFPSGIFVDRYGVKNGLLLWVGLTGASLLSLSFIHYAFLLFLIMVAISGLGYGMGNPVASKGLFIWFDQRTRGMAFGIKQSAVTIGAAVAGIFLVYLSQRIGPFLAFRTVSLMILTMIIPAFFLYRAPQLGLATPRGSGLKGERSVKSGFRDLFTNKALLAVSVIMAMLGLAQGVVVTFFILYVNEMLGYPLLAAGSLLTMVMISGAVGRVFWGVLSDHLFNGSRKPVLIIISTLAALSFAILAFWSSAWIKQLFLPVVIGIGLSAVGWNSIALVMVTEISSSSKTGTSIGLATTVSWAGLSLGPIVFGSLTDHFGYFFSWISLALFCCICLILCLLIPVSKAKRQ
jgi:MFS transporter, ACS family, hexuronate transporter